SGSARWRGFPDSRSRSPFARTLRGSRFGGTSRRTSRGLAASGGGFRRTRSQQNLVAHRRRDVEHHHRGDRVAQALPLLAVGPDELEVVGERADAAKLGDGKLPLLGRI